MIGIISDIHGNHEALKAVLEYLEQSQVNSIVCLGDVAGYYCQINECCETLQKLSIPTLMGNHDYYLTSGEGCPRSNSANQCLEHQRQIIEADNYHWLSSLPDKMDWHGISMRHGGWHDPLDEYMVPSKEYFANFSGQFFSSGHTHVPVLWNSGNIFYCNPGSVGQPRDGDCKASFAIYCRGKFTLHRVAYDYKKVQMQMKKAGFPSYFYTNLASGSRIGGKIDSIDSLAASVSHAIC